MIKVYEALKWASSFLEAHKRDTNIGEIYLCHLMQWSRSTMLMNLREPLEEHIFSELQSVVKSHAIDGVPIQQIMGYEHFYGRIFSVTKDVLIPRPETEELVELVLSYADEQLINQEKVTVSDIGVGSGAICITLQCERPHWEVYGVDISKKALQVAAENNAKLGSNVTFLHGDLLQPLIDKHMRFDIIVSNPPYISETDYETLADVVRNYEPKLALVAEENGLALYRRLLHQIPYILNENGAVFFEYGVNQGELIKNITLELYPKANVTIVYDINGKDRMIKITGITPSKM